MDYTNLKALIVNNVYNNITKSITGQALQDTLLDIVNGIGDGAVFKGILIPTSINDNPDANVFYVASLKGVYTNFGFTIENNGVHLIQYNVDHWIATPVYEMSDVLGSSDTIGVTQHAVYNSWWSNRAIINTNSANIISNGSAIANLRNDVENFETTYETIDGSNSKIAIVTGRLDTTDGELVIVKQTQDTLSGNITTISTTVDGQQTAIATINTTLNEFSTNYATNDYVAGELGTITSDLGIVSGKVTDIENADYGTLIQQNKTSIQLVAAKFDPNTGALLNSAGLVTTADANTMYAFDASGNIVSFIEQTPSTIKITANNIILEGLVTANDNFKILADGSIESVNGTFTGVVTATSGSIGGFDIHDGYIGVDKNGTLQGMFITDTAMGVRTVETNALRMSVLGDYANSGDIGSFVNYRATTTEINKGLYIKTYGSSVGNLALDVQGGQYRGFNMPIRTVDSNDSPTWIDSYIIGIATSSITITLPNLDREFDGHVFYVKIGEGGSPIGVVPQTGAHIWSSNGTTDYDQLTQAGEMTMYVYDYASRTYMGGNMGN